MKCKTVRALFSLVVFFLSIPILISGTFAGTYVIPDFKVNQDGGMGDKQVPAVALDKTGNAMAVWTDYRDGDPTIYAQRYNSSGIAQGGNFRVSDKVDAYPQGAPSVSADGLGNFIVVWEEGPGYGKWIFAQRFDAAGKKLGDQIRVNTDVGSVSVHDAAVAADGSGGFVVVWVEDRDAKSTVYGQRFNAAGMTLGANFIVESSLPGNNQFNPAVAMDGSGNFIAAWQQDVTIGYDIRAQLFDNSGTRIGQVVRINKDIGIGSQTYPAAAVNVNGKGMVVWSDQRNGNADIYGRYFDFAGSFDQADFKVNDDAGNASQLYPCVTVDRTGYFAVAWQDDRKGSSDIYMQRYRNPWLLPLANIKVNDNPTSAYQSHPAMAMNENGDFFVVWQDRRNDFNELYAQRFTTSAALVKSNFKLADDQGSAEQIHSDIAVSPAGDFMIVWQDRRNGYSDIYAQFYNAAGVAQGNNIKVNNNTAPVHNNPVIACYADGYFIIAWEAVSYGIPDIYAQDFSQTGTPRGANFKVNDDAWGSRHAHPVVCANGQAYILIAWEDERNGNVDIYAQRYDSALNQEGGNFKVNDNSNPSSQSMPSVAMDQSSTFVVVWQDDRANDMDIYGQRYNSSGVPIKSNFWINDDAGQAGQFTPTVAMDPAGNFAVVWADARNDTWRLYGQRYDAAGTKKGGNFMIQDQYGGIDPVIAMNNTGEFLVAWCSWNWLDSDVYARRFNNHGEPIGERFLIPQQGLYHQKYPRIQLFEHTIYTTWESNYLKGVGYDIEANVLDWNSQNTGVTLSDKKARPVECRLAQNFPNPFNSHTVFRYHLSASHWMHLEIVDITGKIVRILYDGEQSTGHHQLIWDGCDENGKIAASGFYFCRLITQNRDRVVERHTIKLHYIR